MRFLIFPKIFENDYFLKISKFSKSDTYLPLTLATPRRQRVHASSMLRATDHKSPKIHFFIFLANFQNDLFFEVQNCKTVAAADISLCVWRRRAEGEPKRARCSARPVTDHQKFQKKYFLKFLKIIRRICTKSVPSVHDIKFHALNRP